MSKITRKKIALIGSGQIGGILALLTGLKNLGDVVLYDIVEGMPQGKALDITHAAPMLGFDCTIKGTNSLADIEGANVCIVTSGLARKPGMSRDDLIAINAKIIKDVATGIKKYAPDSFVIVITNPLDAMAYLMYQELGFSSKKVVGMAGVLDSGRYRAHLAEALNVSVNSVSAFVLGGHGDTMVPIRSYTTCGGIPVAKLLSEEVLNSIEDRVKNSGGEVVALLKTGSAFCSPAVAAIEMAQSYLLDEKRIMAAAALCNGEYGINGYYVGVPVKIGVNGIESILEIELTDKEKVALARSVESVKELVAALPK
jgi:malate dehydrogenase